LTFWCHRQHPCTACSKMLQWCGDWSGRPSSVLNLQPGELLLHSLDSHGVNIKLKERIDLLTRSSQGLITKAVANTSWEGTHTSSYGQTSGARCNDLSMNFGVRFQFHQGINVGGYSSQGGGHHCCSFRTFQCIQFSKKLGLPLSHAWCTSSCWDAQWEYSGVCGAILFQFIGIVVIHWSGLFLGVARHVCVVTKLIVGRTAWMSNK